MQKHLDTLPTIRLLSGEREKLPQHTHTKHMKIRNTIIVEIARNIKTRTGTADLYKLWDEEAQHIASVWSDSAKPSPFLSGKAVGDPVRLVEEVRTEVNMDGKPSERVFYTVLPSAPSV